jgi:hypothetical protein
MTIFRRVFSKQAQTAPILELEWQAVSHLPTNYVNRDSFRVGDSVLRQSQITVNGMFHTVGVHHFTDALRSYGSGHPLNRGIIPQFAALAYDVTHNPQVMTLYFPLTTFLDEGQQRVFAETTEALIHDQNFGLRVWTTNHRDISDSAPPSISYLIAGQIVEIFFFRPDLRAKLFSTPRYFNIYMNHQAYLEGGGVSGGCYDPKSGSIKLVASRLYEGFYGRTPGVAPFIHEFGHMLDHIDLNRGLANGARGLLPGMRDEDSELFSPEAKMLFVEGKKLELERYEQGRLKRPDDVTKIPIGHPYVFQNDGEFIAGYLEMFFRNPNYFHQQNSTLYEGFVKLFHQDPRTYWADDFDYYIKQNQAVYLEHRQGIHPSGLQVFS